MSVDTATILICAALAALVAASALFNVFFRRPRKGGAAAQDDVLPSLSVVIAAHDSGAELERNLPAILSQDYGGDFEVIVVDESSTDDTDDVLTRLKAGNARLYSTFIPESSRYISRRKLAMTLGVRAAHGEWIIFVDADCRPVGDRWLAAIASHCDDGTDMVMGYCNYDVKTKPFRRFLRFITSCYALHRAQRGTAYRHSCGCLAVRRSLFVESGGFRANEYYLRGEYDFIVNELAKPHRTAVALEPEARMEQCGQSRKAWSNAMLCYMETRRHLRGSLLWRLAFDIDQFFLHVSYVAEIAVAAYAVAVSNVPLAVVAVFFFVLTVALRLVIAGKALRYIGETLPLWRVPLMEVRVLWHNAVLLLRHSFSNKRDYTVSGRQSFPVGL